MKTKRPNATVTANDHGAYANAHADTDAGAIVYARVGARAGVYGDLAADVRCGVCGCTGGVWLWLGNDVAGAVDLSMAVHVGTDVVVAMKKMMVLFGVIWMLMRV